MRKILLLLPALVLIGCQSTREIDPKTKAQISRADDMVSSSSQLRKLKKRSDPYNPYRYEDYIKAGFYGSSISPDGKKVTMKDYNGKHIRNLEKDNKWTFYSRDICDGKAYVNSFSMWINSESLLVSCQTYGEKNELYRVDVESWLPKKLTEKPARYYPFDLDKDRKVIYVAAALEDDKYLDVHELNWETGATKKVFDNKDKDLSSFFIRDSKVVGYTEEINGKFYVNYLKNNQFKPVMTLAREDVFYVLFPVKSDKNKYLVRTNVGRNTMVLAEYDFATNKVVRVLSERPDVNAGGAFYSSDRRLLGVGYNPDLVSKRYDFFSKKLENNFKSAERLLKQAEPNAVRVDLRDVSDDETKLIVSARDTSAMNSVYWFDANTSELKPLSMPEIKSQEMFSPMRAIKFKSRDGVDIHGYLTLPEMKNGKKPTLLVMPHGGPVGVSDGWYYQTDAQYLAAHGYAVLQVNYRVSGGRNKAFQKAGYGKLGFLPLQDIEDGVQYVINQGWVKEKPVVSFGISYGGYAVMRGATLYPKRYSCIASMVGVYDVEDVLKNAPKHWLMNESFYSVYSDQYTTKGDQALRDISPLYEADKINIPVFILHGEDDIRINIKQSNDMVEALRKHNKNVYYFTSEDGHSFISPRETMDMLIGFFDECLAK